MKKIEGFCFLYHIFVVKVQEIAWSASYGENRTQNPKRTNKGNIWHQISSSGVRTGPRPTYGCEIQTSKIKETLPKPADSMKNKNLNLAFLRRHKVTKATTLEEREEIEKAADVGCKNMPGGKAGAVDLMKRPRAPRRVAEDQTGASGPMPRTP